MKSFRRYPELLFVMVFLASLFVPLVLSFYSVGGVSLLEKRVLASPPKLSSLRDLPDFPARFDRFFRDNFGLRWRLMALHFRLVSGPLFARIRHDALVGKDGWLFWGEEQALRDIRGDFPPPGDFALERWYDLMENRREWLRQLGIPLLVVISPDKPTIYPEYLPDGIRAPGARTMMDYMSEYLKRRKADWVLDLRPVLLEAKRKRKELLYYPADSHWNMLGAYFAHRAIEAALTRMGLKLKPTPIRDSDIHFDPNDLGAEFLYVGDAWAARGGYAVRHPVLDCIGNARVPVFTDNESVHRNTEATKCARGSLRALVITDSFLERLKPYLSTTFARAVYLNIGDGHLGTKPLVEIEKPDVVIYGLVERRIVLNRPQWLLR